MARPTRLGQCGLNERLCKLGYVFLQVGGVETCGIGICRINR